MRQFTNSSIPINHHHLVMPRTHSPEKGREKARDKARAKENIKEASTENPATREGRPMENRVESKSLIIVGRLSGTAVIHSPGFGTASADGTGNGIEEVFIPSILDDLPFET